MVRSRGKYSASEHIYAQTRIGLPLSGFSEQSRLIHCKHFSLIESTTASVTLRILRLWLELGLELGFLRYHENDNKTHIIKRCFDEYHVRVLVHVKQPSSISFV